MSHHCYFPLTLLFILCTADAERCRRTDRKDYERSYCSPLGLPPAGSLWNPESNLKSFASPIKPRLAGHRHVLTSSRTPKCTTRSVCSQDAESHVAPGVSNSGTGPSVIAPLSGGTSWCCMEKPSTVNRLSLSSCLATRKNCFHALHTDEDW